SRGLRAANTYQAVSQRQYLFRIEITSLPPGLTSMASVCAIAVRSAVQFNAPRLEYAPSKLAAPYSLRSASSCSAGRILGVTLDESAASSRSLSLTTLII